MPSLHRLELDVPDQPDVLQRIITVCRRRGCRIVTLRYVAADAGALGRVELDVEGPHAARVDLWLAGLVDVLAVRPAGPIAVPADRALRGAART